MESLSYHLSTLLSLSSSTRRSSLNSTSAASTVFLDHLAVSSSTPSPSFISSSSSSLCYDPEGWGPYSTIRSNDLTPCFESAALMLPTGLLLFAGGLMVFVLTKRAKKEKGRRGDWSDRLLSWKLALITILFAISIVNLTSLTPTLSIDFLSSLLLVLATVLAHPLTYLTHTRTRRASDILLPFWTLFIFLAIPSLRTRYLIGFKSDRDVGAWVIFLIFVVVGAVVLALECLGPEFEGFGGRIKLEEEDVVVVENEAGEKEEEPIKENPALTANFFSRITFSYLSPLMKLGASRHVEESDIFDLVPSDHADVLSSRLAHEWSLARERAHANSTPAKPVKPSLFRALAGAYGGPYFVAGIFKLVNDCLSFSQPQLLRLLLKFVATYRTESPDPAIKGVMISCAMFGAALIQTTLLHQYFDRCFATGMRVKAGIITLLFQKSLLLSNGEKTGRTTGDIINLQSVDALRIGDLCAYGMMLWSGPVQITLAFVSLYNLLGWSALCGIAVMLISLPLAALIARMQKKLQVQQMKIKDARTRLMNEILSNIKSIKLYAWEQAFSERVLKVRNEEELKVIRKIGIVNAFSGFVFVATPVLVAFASFSVYAYTSKTALTSDIIFPAISLFTLLQFPLFAVSMIIAALIEAIVSEGRLVSFLDAAELQTDARTVIETSSDLIDLEGSDELVSIKEGSFKWLSSAEEPTLKGINLSVKKGELVGVLGRVGDGKTSLLSALLGEMTRSAGEVVARGKIAYYSQSSWILSATVKENIIFGHAYDHDFYLRVLDACALAPDLAILPEGDLTEVGEKGVSLSGGQKARIALARCVYARADIYLLDDPLCAVDNHVAAHLFAKVLGPNGLLKNKARILCTNSVAFLSQTDNLLMLRGGEIVEQSTYEKVMEARDSPLFSLINGLGKQTDSSPGTPGEQSDDATAVDLTDELDKLGEKANRSRRSSTSSSRRAVLLSTEQCKAKAFKDLRDSARPKESMERGQVKTRVYREYISAASGWGVALFLFATFAAQGFSIGGNLVLRAWGEHNLEENKTASIGLFLFFYGITGLSSSLLSMVASLLLWTYMAIRCSRKLHDSSFKALMRSPLSYFESTPQGRILNLFSRDIHVVDEVLIGVFNDVFRCFAVVGGVMVVVGYGAPAVLIGVIPVGLVYRVIMKYYLATSRELKRLDATSRAPIFSWFGETLNGLSVIRAFGQQDRFLTNNEARLDRSNSCYLPSVSVNRWLAVRLEFLGSLLMFSAALASVFALVSSQDVDAGLVGLILSYALSVPNTLNWLVRSSAEVENNIVSVERLVATRSLVPEAPDEIEETKPSASWPEEGAIEFRDYSTRYRADLEPCVRGVSIKINAGDHLGVCGRTGAGKSSLTLALFRIIEATEGSIWIDGVDISTLGLHELRSKISIIPQDPQLFEGTLRENVDPLSQYSDDLIWQALEHAHLKSFVEKMDGKLDGAVSEGGQNLSSGQRQLVSIARALLRKSRILVLDEATSAIDLETDAAVQEILRGPDFASITTITIAHRLDTILHSTRVLVMDAGKVAELDTPAALLAKKDSVFYSLAEHAGLVGAGVEERD